MSDSHTQFALREVRAYYSNPKTLVALGGIAVILGMAGPFGTSGFMRVGPLVVYWFIITFTTFAAGAFVGAWSSDFSRARGLSQMVSILLTSVGTGVAAIFIVVMVNWAALGLAPSDTGYVVSLAITTFITATIIAVILYFSGIDRRDAPVPQADATHANTPAPSRILERLPLEKRGALISMSVSDHYVEVTTTKGAELILMRLGDAMAEASGGMQVHRSHWVALDQVSKAARQGDRAVLTLSDGRDIPVSRSYVPAIKEAGLLPR